MAGKRRKKQAKGRRTFDNDFKQEAVQMVLDGHSVKTVAERLGCCGELVVSLESTRTPRRGTGCLVARNTREGT